MALGIQITSLLTLCLLVSSGQPPDILVGVILNEVPFDLDYLHFKPSVDIAFDEINRRIQQGEYLNFSMSYIFRKSDDNCGAPKMKAPGVAAEIYHNYHVSAFVGPLCSGETEPVADLCAHWEIPILSGASTSGILDNKSRYSTLTRTSYKLSNLVYFMGAVFEKYNWKQCSIVWDNTRAFWRSVLTPSLLRLLGRTGIKIRDFEMNSFDLDTLKSTLQAATERGRSKYHPKYFFYFKGKESQHIFQYSNMPLYF